MQSGYVLFLDDLREPNMFFFGDDANIKIARNIQEAKEIIFEYDMPNFLALDHDLGMVDGKIETVSEFLDWLIDLALDWKVAPPQYNIHSDNPVGKKNLEAKMNSWQKVFEIQEKEEIR